MKIKCLPIWTSLCVSFKQRVYPKLSENMEDHFPSNWSLRKVLSQCTPIPPPPIILQQQKIWSVDGVLHQSPLWWYPTVHLCMDLTVKGYWITFCTAIQFNVFCSKNTCLVDTAYKYRTSQQQYPKIVRAACFIVLLVIRYRFHFKQI
jgi:hypothetical protein